MLKTYQRLVHTRQISAKIASKSESAEISDRS